MVAEVAPGVRKGDDRKRGRTGRRAFGVCGGALVWVEGRHMKELGSRETGG